ncbi:MAG: hypothetical protein K0Q79_1813 [Flavipsychrobacter sp.]|jgi:hypothetical protein|nr:hypothetical protein [Flavipsychrobacter sp.]
MKKLILLVLGLYAAVSVNASTSITTPTVSGHWTLTGSPYLVYNNIQVPASQALIIDPGVEVVFQGSYAMKVSGILYATGTSAQPINIHVNDTSGWWNDSVVNGGWLGIGFDAYTGSGTDSSILEYCNISEVKIPLVSSALAMARGIPIKNCSFQNNKGGTLLYFYYYTPQTIEISGCTITNNSFGNIIFVSNFFGGSTYIHDNHIYQNTAATRIITGMAVNLLFEKNEVDHNTSRFGTMFLCAGIGFDSIDSKATITGNKIHHNINENIGALCFYSGFIDIRNNLICNNQHTSGFCGITDGGGAMNLAYNSPTPIDSTFYTIRNNVIANNYSPYHGGAIKIHRARASITNNQVVNNTSPAAGSIYVFGTSPLVCKNNIFYGNTATGSTSLLSPVVEGPLLSTILFENNWKEHSSLIDIGTYTSIGDTTTNITGTSPGFSAPTLTTSVTEDAVTADFWLVPGSACIDMGDTTSALTLSTDCAGNTRLVGNIDIGAYEFATTLGLPPGRVPPSITAYPNPAVNVLFIRTPVANGNISILNAVGKKISESTVSRTLTYFDIHTIPRGIYFAIWDNGAGTKATQKIILE